MNAEIKTLLTVAVLALVTALTRVLPFLLLKSGRAPSKKAEKVLRALPGASMGLLVVYCLKDVSFASPAGYLPALLGCLVTAGTALWKRNGVFAIVLGTAAYMVTVGVV